MGIEIERKFLVDAYLWQRQHKPTDSYFKQGYLLNEHGKTIRLRISGTHAWLTFKGPVTGISRSEYEYEIPVTDGQELFKLFADTYVEKTRYCISYEDKLWEVDEFLGDNEGLIVAEVELESPDETFSLPEWIITEVTGNERYYNARLSVTPFKNW